MSTASPRVSLRDLKLEDAKSIFYLLSHPLVTQKLPDEDHLSSFSEAQQVLEGMIEDTIYQRRFCQALISIPDQKLIGTLVANRFDKETRSAYIAYELDPRYWGQGLMGEGLQQFLPYIRKLFSLKEIKAQTTLDNDRSQRVLEKQGFRKVKVFEYNKPVNGHYVRALLYKRILPQLTNSLHDLKPETTVLLKKSASHEDKLSSFSILKKQMSIPLNPHPKGKNDDFIDLIDLFSSLNINTSCFRNTLAKLSADIA